MGIVGFLFWSAIAYGAAAWPILAMSRRLFGHVDGRAMLAVAATAAGFLFGGRVGWRLASARWTRSFSDTIAAAGSAASYGAAVEHAAERALLWFLYPASFGALMFGLAMLVVLARLQRLALQAV